MEYQSSFLALPPPIHQAVDLPATHQLSLNISDPDTPLYRPPMRVSEKLFHNKIRKLQLQFQQEKEKESLLKRRKEKEKEIYEFELRRQALAQEQREVNLKANRFELNQKEKYEQKRHNEKLSQQKASDAMIDLCRKKVQEKKQEYVIRIQSKTRQRHQKAQQKRKRIQKSTEKINDEIHLEEWKQYETNLLKKHPKQLLQPDRLYQQFKKKTKIEKPIFRQKSKQNQEYVTPKPITSASTKSQPQLKSLPRASTSHLILKANKKAQFYGVHQTDMMRQTLKELPKMRKFIQEHTIVSDPLQDSELIDKFQRFLFQEVLK